MANQYITRQEVLNGYSAAFMLNLFILKYADKTLVNRTAEWDLPIYGNGATIQVRKYPITPVTRVNIATLNGPLTKTIQNVEQETVDVTVDQFLYSAFQINAVNEKLFLNGRAADDETMHAAVKPAAHQVNKDLYEGLILNANILALSPSTTLNTQKTLGSINVVAHHNNMPAGRCLMVSPTAINDLTTHFGTYLNSKASSPALENRLPGFGYFSEIGGDNVVEEFITGTANTNTGTTTLSVAAVNDDVTLTIDFTVATGVGLTIGVGDPLSLDSATVQAVARASFQNIPRTIQLPSFIAADAPASNPDFTPAVKDANGITITRGFYTVPVTGIVTVSLSQKVATSGNFQTISAPSAIVPIGTPVRFYDNHVVSFMISESGINFASPRIKRIENATNLYSRHEEIDMRFATQGNLLTETNTKELAMMWGKGYDSFYLIRVMSNN